jgi:hypothetical protein
MRFDMENELKQAQTMAQILAICAKYYDLNDKLGIATKGVVVMGVKNAIKLINAKPKQ